MTKNDLHIAFMGTPDFALPSLQMLYEEDYDIALVITQPDRPKGRGHRLSAPPIKTEAQRLHLPVWQPERLRDPDNVKFLRQSGANLFITAAYGQILSEGILEIPEYGCINVHASLLPAYRGAAPIVWSIINGERHTGVTTMRTVKALDAGPILEQETLTIDMDMTGGQLQDELSQLGARTLRRTLEKLLNGKLVETAQDESASSYYPMLGRDFGEIDWDQPTARILDFIRALAPVPGAYFRLPGDERIRVYKASVAAGRAVQPGKIVSATQSDGLVISGSDGLISLDVIKRPGSRKMTAKELLRGRPITAECVERRIDKG